MKSIYTCINEELAMHILISLPWQDMEVDASVLPRIRCFDSSALCGQACPYVTALQTEPQRMLFKQKQIVAV